MTIAQGVIPYAVGRAKPIYADVRWCVRRRRHNKFALRNLKVFLMPEYTPHQQKIIQRYYANQGDILQQRIAALVGDLYLASGKKSDSLWKTAASILKKIGVPQSRIDHLLTKRNPALLAELITELESKRS